MPPKTLASPQTLPLHRAYLGVSNAASADAALVLSSKNCGERAEYCFESTVSEKRTHWVLRQTRWVLRETRWVRVCTQIIGRKELTEFGPRNSVSPKKLTEFGVWNRTLRNRIRPVSEIGKILEIGGNVEKQIQKASWASIFTLLPAGIDTALVKAQFLFLRRADTQTLTR